MTVYAITDTKKGRTGIALTYFQTTQDFTKTQGYLKCQEKIFAGFREMAVMYEF